MEITVARFCVTPVKGLALNHPEEIALTEIGAPENRRFYMVDAGGAMVSADRFGPMQLIAAAFDPEADTLQLSFPDGAAVIGEAAGSGDAVITDFYGRPVESHVVLGPFAQALSDALGFAVRLVRTDAPGEASDVHHLTLVSNASVQALGSAGGAPDIDARRFRMLFELDGCEPYEEDRWDGQRLQIGESVVRVCGQVPRCVITTQSPKTGLKDFDTLKVIATSRGRTSDGTGLPFGMYAEVEIPGRVRVGDSVTPRS